MIFTEQNFKNGELKAVMPISTGLSWSKMQFPLQNAQDEFIQPLLGDELIEAIEAINEKEEVTPFEKKLMYYTRKAIGNLAFFTNFDELNVRITDQGFQRQTSENGTFAPTYKYQEDNLRKSFQNKGYNAIDEMLAMLFYDKTGTTYSILFKATDTYKKVAGSIVRSVEEVQMVYGIHYSYLLFLALKAKMDTIEELLLMPILGINLYNALKSYLKDDAEDSVSTWYEVGTEQVGSDVFKELRLRCGKVLTMKAVLEMLRTTGTITDRGVFYKADSTSSSFAESSQPDSDARLQLMINDAQKALDGFISSLTTFVNANLQNEENKITSPLHALDRDNDGKKAFFA